MKRVGLVLALMSASVILFSVPVLGATNNRKPNVIVILSDDLGSIDAGCTNVAAQFPEIVTRLRQLAASEAK